MKKTIAILLMLCLCIGLCGCGNGSSAQIEYPEGWDRIAEATATLNAYYACETEDEFKAVCHSSFPSNDLKMIVEGWRDFREAFSMDAAGLSKIYVRKIKYIETHNGYDVFLVAQGYEHTDGSRTPDDPLPSVQVQPGHELFVIQPSQVASGSLIALTIENGRYVLANDPKFQSYTEKFAMCTCDLGTVVVPGDPCKSCDGAGFMTEQSSTDVENEANNEDDDICATCNGVGWIANENDTEDISDSDQTTIVVMGTPCPDCSGAWVGGIIDSPDRELQIYCSDCEGTGLESYSYGDCSDCSGQGYKKIG